MSSQPDSIQAIKVFLSYSSKDERLKKQLDRHLSSRKSRGVIDTWEEEKISAGKNKEQAISKHFEEANIILCLISPEFVNCDYCYTIQLPRALEKKRSGEAKVIPILLRDVDWSITPFGELGLQVLPRNKVPIASASNRDRAMREVVQEIARVVAIIRGESV